MSEEAKDTEVVEELSDQDLWDQTGKEPEKEPEPEPEPEQEEEPEETIDVSETQENVLDDEDTSEVVEVEHKEEPKTDYQDRYKNLEKDYHRRNEESARLREEHQQLRLERLEQQKELDALKAQLEKAPKAPTKPDPSDETYFTDEDKQTMDDFSEITGVVKKLIQHEMAKGRKDPALASQADEINSLKESVQQYQRQQYLNEHDKFMQENVGADYKEIDKDEDFYEYVMASPMRKQAMTQSQDARDHAAVMQDFLNSPKGKDKFRKEPEPEPEKPAVSPQKQARRQAASGLLKNTAQAKADKRQEDMSDEELWESI